jgi:hypothetical protein
LNNSTIERYKRGRLNGDLLKEFQDRRYPEDGKTIMQRTQEYKNYMILSQGTKPSTYFDFESNDSLTAKANCVNISLGTDKVMIYHNIYIMKRKELISRNDLVDENLEINLSADLNIE